MELGENDVVMTVATDGAPLYATELSIAEAKYHSGRMDKVTAAETFGRAILGATNDNMIEMGRYDRERVFNLGYYTWVEQQAFSGRFRPTPGSVVLDGLLDLVPVWDEMIDGFNRAG